MRAHSGVGSAHRKLPTDSQALMRATPFTMDDLEDLVYFFMNAHIDRPVSKSILASVLCDINGVPDRDPAVLSDIENWLTNAKKKQEGQSRQYAHRAQEG